MKEIITIYRKHRPFIENSLISMMEAIDLKQYDEMKESAIFSLFPALRSTYKINEGYQQSTPVYTPEEVDKSSVGTDKSHLLSRIRFRDDNIYISNSYISSVTATPFLTIVFHFGKEYLVYDFELYTLLKEFMLIKGDKRFSRFTQSFYAFFGFVLVLFSITLVSSAIYIIYNLLFVEHEELLSGIFHSIIALTLGLAIFDLAKTILEHEVFYKELSRNNNLENKLLARFLVSIIIALSIEALMVVFKIVLSDYSKMLYAFYLIAGVGVMIVSLSIFIFIMRYQGSKE